MNLLVISSCSARKLAREARARELYQGANHRRLAAAIDRWRADGHYVTWDIVSARFGVLREDELTPPYDDSLRGLDERALRRRGAELGLDVAFRRSLGLDGGVFDLVLVLLSRAYLTAAHIDRHTALSHKAVVFADKRARLPFDALVLSGGNAAAAALPLRAGTATLKAALAERVVALASAEGVDTTLARLRGPDPLTTLIARCESQRNPTPPTAR